MGGSSLYRRHFLSSPAHNERGKVPIAQFTDLAEPNSLIVAGRKIHTAPMPARA
jgi:hypothetical protein